jgi:hypothetical protein
MQKSHITPQKLIEDFFASWLPQSTEVPKGMVEDDEYFRTPIQHRKQCTQMRIGRRPGICGQIGNNLLGSAARQIVNTEMKNRSPDFLTGGRRAQ